MVQAYEPTDPVPAVSRIAEGVVEAYRAGSARLWLADLAEDSELVDELGPWCNEVRVAAENHASRWLPDQDVLLDRLTGRAARSGAPIIFSDALQELLPLAREDFARSLESRQIPRQIVERAKNAFYLDPPLEQWKM